MPGDRDVRTRPGWPLLEAKTIDTDAVDFAQFASPLAEAEMPPRPLTWDTIETPRGLLAVPCCALPVDQCRCHAPPRSVDCRLPIDCGISAGLAATPPL